MKLNGHGSQALPSPAQPVRVVDVYNMDRSAKELHTHRGELINQSGRYENLVVCSDGPWVSHLRRRGVEVIPSPIPRGITPGSFLRGVMHLTKVLRRTEPLIVHSHGSTAGACARLAARRAGVPLVIHTVHGFHFHNQMSAVVRRAFARAERLLARYTDVLLFQNREDLEESFAYRIQARRGNVEIGNGINLDRIAMANGSRRLGQPPVVLMLARFEPVKNHEMLLRASRELLNRNVAFQLWLAGEGVLQPRCRKLVEKLGLRGRVRFLGYVEPTASLLHRATVAVLPSVKEGIPRGLLEPMAAGVPVVATNVKGNRETVVHGKTGMLVPLGDHRALATALEQLLSDAALCHRLSEQARASVCERFDETQVVNRLLAVYDGLVSGHVSGGPGSCQCAQQVVVPRLFSSTQKSNGRPHEQTLEALPVAGGAVHQRRRLRARDR